MKRTVAILAWLIVGHAVIGGLFWVLLLVPESNVSMLAASLLLVLGIVWSIGLVESTALLAFLPGGGIRQSLGPAARRAWMVVFPLAVFALVWWVTATFSGWLDRHWSEIDAWILLKTGWTKAALLASAIDHVTAFVQFGVSVSLALALLAALLRNGLKELLSTSWLRLALSWRLLLVIVAALVVGLLAPSHLAYWRWQPKNLTATWFEPTFAAAKLSVMYLLANMAWAAVVRAVARGSVREIRSEAT